MNAIQVTRVLAAILVLAIGLVFFLSDAPPPLDVKAPAFPLPAPDPIVSPAAAKGPRATFISVAAPGYSLEEIETAVAGPLERAVLGLTGVVSVRTHIRPGHCRVKVDWAPGRDGASTIVQAIMTATKPMPADVERLVVQNVDPEAVPVLWIAARGATSTLADLTAVVQAELRPRLERISGVADVQLRGEARTQPRIDVALESLTRVNLSLGDVTAAIEKAIVTDKSAAARGTFDIESLAAVVIGQVEGAAIRLRDVASVAMGARRTGFARYEGAPAVLMGVQIAPDADASVVAAAVRKLVSETSLPAGVTLDVIADATRADAESLLIELRSPHGTTLDAAARVTAAIEAAITDRLAPAEIGEPVTLGLGPDGDPTRTQLLLSLPGKHSATTQDILQRVRKAALGFPDIRARIQARRGMLPATVEVPVVIHIYGDDREQLTRWHAEILRGAGEEPAFVELSAPEPRTAPELRVVLDREKTAALGINQADLAGIVDTAINGRSFRSGGAEVRLSMGDFDRAGIGKLLVRASDGKLVPLESVAMIEARSSLVELERINGRRCLTIAAAAQAPATSESANAKLRDIADKARHRLSLPDTYQVVVE